MINFWEFIVVLMLIVIYLIPITLKLCCYAWSSWSSRRIRRTQAVGRPEDTRSSVYSIECSQNSNEYVYDPPPSYDSVVKQLSIDTGQTTPDMKVSSIEAV